MKQLFKKPSYYLISSAMDGNEKTVKIAICVMERASEKTEDTFINIPIYTESHNLSILGNLYRQTRHLLESVMIYR